jgi:hypothetical protein
LRVQGSNSENFQNNEISLLSSAVRSIREKEIIVVSVKVETKTMDMGVLTELGASVGHFTEKAVKVETLGLSEQKRKYRGANVADINPADFAHFLTGLEAEKNLTLPGLSSILTEKTARELILLWRNETPAQKELMTRGTPSSLAVLAKTKSIFREYDLVLRERLKANPEAARKILMQAGISKENIERALSFAQSSQATDGMIKSLALIMGNKPESFVISFLEGL